MAACSVLERILCMLVHISLTLVAAYGIQKEEKKYLPIAILAHVLADLLSCLSQRGLVSIAAVEVWLFVCTVILVICGRRLYQNME